MISGRVALVTGGSGFIGTHLSASLARQGCFVHSVSRTTEPREIGRIRHWAGDLSDLASTRNILSVTRPDIIFHLAGYVSGSRELSSVLPAFRDNLATTLHLLMAAAELGCQRLILAGSLEEPGPGSSVVIPCSPYAASKLAATAYGQMFHSLYGLPVVVARLFMVYGPGQDDHRKLIPYVISCLLKNEAPALTSGYRLVDWIFVQDVVEGLLAVAQAQGIEGQTIDIGSGNLVSIRHTVEYLVEIVNPNIRPAFGVLPDRPMEQVRAANISESKGQTGWYPQTSLAEGLRRTAYWYQRREEAGISVAEKEIAQ